jgi:hypothetical protein
MGDKTKEKLIEIFNKRGFISTNDFEDLINTNSQVSFLCDKGHLCETKARYIIYGNIGCKTCQYDKKRNIIDIDLIDTELKKCNLCSDVKNKSCYGKLSKNIDGLRNTCKLCRRKQNTLDDNGKIKRKESSLKYCKEKPFSALLSRCKSNHNKKGMLDFDITEDFLKYLYDKQNGKCFWSDIELPIDNFGLGELNAISVDRLDSDNGYKQGNVVLSCKFYNLGKGNMNTTDFVKFLKENGFKISIDIDDKLNKLN